MIPDDYLSWLSTSIVMTDPKWTWLKDSLIAELKHRGFKYEQAQQSDPEIIIPDPEPPKIRKIRAID